MTTTYNPTQQNAPTLNAEGEKVWKPSVGVVFKPAEDQAHSYGGIIGALQDRIATQGALPKAYPHNFAGIIAAIQDLESAEEQIPVLPGPIPPGTDIDINTGDLIVIVPPKDGQLWFDTRQGRLFVAIDGEWWQTNGADGIAFVRNTSNPPETTEVVPGQFWYDDDGNDLYVFNGTDWVLIADGTDAGAFQTTATLPLASTGPRESITSYVGTIIPIPDLDNFNTQQDYNIWAFDAIVALEDELGDLAPVIVDENKPDNPKVGQLWYDTESLEMSVWYEDDDSGQWVPTAASYTYDEDIAVLRADIQTESRTRETAIHSIHQLLDTINATDAEEVTQLTADIQALQTAVAAKAEADALASYAQTSYVNTEVSQAKTDLMGEISAVNSSIPSLNGYATEAELDEEVHILENLIATKTTMVEVHNHVAEILDNGNYSTQTYLDQSLATLSQNYLTHAGGTMTGNLVINKVDLADAALDFSSEPASGSPAFKFYTRSSDYTSVHYPTFGTTNEPSELAWNFDGDEDFCWIYSDTNKVFSITKDGPACSTLILGDISSNNTGRIIHNKIDLKERINSYKVAFQQMRQGVSDATDFDTLKANILTALASV